MQFCFISFLLFTFLWSVCCLWDHFSQDLNIKTIVNRIVIDFKDWTTREHFLVARDQIREWCQAIGCKQDKGAPSFPPLQYHSNTHKFCPPRSITWSFCLMFAVCTREYLHRKSRWAKKNGNTLNKCTHYILMSCSYEK